MIHPTAVIEDGAQLAEDVDIGPYCVVGAQVKDRSRAHGSSAMSMWKGGRT